jgi:uncharacterized protein
LRSVTPDSNIYISALNWGGKPLQLLEMALAGEVRLFISDAIMEETLEVLERKFNFSPERLQKTQAYIASCSVRVEPKVTLNVVEADPDDNRIVECAVESGSEQIITHDNDLLRMKEYKGIKIMKVAEFLRQGPERGR